MSIDHYNALTYSKIEQVIKSLYKGFKPCHIFVSSDSIARLTDNEFVNLFNNIKQGDIVIGTTSMGLYLYLLRAKELNLIPII